MGTAEDAEFPDDRAATILLQSTGEGMYGGGGQRLIRGPASPRTLPSEKARPGPTRPGPSVPSDRPSSADCKSDLPVRTGAAAGSSGDCQWGLEAQAAGHALAAEVSSGLWRSHREMGSSQ